SFKTGTPPRVDGRSVDWSEVERQDGDATAYRFSFYERVERPRQVPCWITWAGEEVKDIIRRHLKESALYGGAIASRGPRYCPSVEDKIVKFPAWRRGTLRSCRGQDRKVPRRQAASGLPRARG